MIAVRKGSYKGMSEITQCDLDNIMTVKIEYQEVTLRVIICHAPQETAKYEERADFFNELAVQVERCTTSGDTMILVGDMNARIERVSELEATSSNGKLLKEVIDDYELEVANFHEKTIGKWTRIQPRKDGSVEKSILDYILLEKDVYQKVASMHVDEEKFYCPYRQKKTKKGTNIVFSDHCAMKLTLQIEAGEPSQKHHPEKRWNFSKDGYDRYKEESRKELSISGSVDPTRIYEIWKTEFEKLLHVCFTKKTVKGTDKVMNISRRGKDIRAILSKSARKGKIQRQLAKRYMKFLIEIECKQAAAARARRLKKTMEDLTENEKFSPAGFWKMKKAADRKCKNNEESTCIQKENGVKVEGEKAVIEAYG